MNPILGLGLMQYLMGLSKQGNRSRVVANVPAPQWVKTLLLCPHKTVELGGATFQVSGIYTVVVYGLFRLLWFNQPVMFLTVLVGWAGIFIASVVIYVRVTRERESHKPRKRTRRRKPHRSRK